MNLACRHYPRALPEVAGRPPQPRFIVIALIAALFAHSQQANANPIGFTPIPDDPIGAQTAAEGINNAGEIVGIAQVAPSGVAGPTYAFTYNGGYANYSAPAGGLAPVANGINDAGQVVGSYEQPAFVGKAFAGTTGAISPLVPPGSVEATAVGVNNAGVIVGGYNTTYHGSYHGFIDNGGTFKTFDVPGASSTVLTGINSKGDLAGYYQSAAGSITGFSTNSSGNIVMTVPNGIVRGINDSGQIVGYIGNSGFVDTAGTITSINIDGASSTQVTGISDKGQIVGSYDNPNEHSFIATAPAPPTITTLAKLSQDAYNTNPSGSPIDGFTPVPSLSRTGIAGFAANVYQNGNQVVIAVRGTSSSSLTTEALNIITDSTWVTGASGLALLTLRSDVGALATQLEDVYGTLLPSNPNLEITLTGHSLGGAIAQVVGSAAKIAVTSFDAPGPGAFLGDLSSELDPLTVYNIPSPSTQITNYRLYGDQVSFVGTQLGSTITVANSISNSVVDSSLLPMKWHSYHYISNLIDQLTAGAAQTNGEVGLNITDPVLRLVKLLDNPRVTPSQVIQILVDVAGTPYWIDPDSGTGYLLRGQAGSPCIASVDLPLFGKIGAWDLQYNSNSTWSSVNIIKSDGGVVFNQCVSALQFNPADLAGDPIFNSDSFIFGLTFASTGEFDGTLTTFGGSESVPAPGSLLLFSPAALLVIVLTFGSRTAGGCWLIRNHLTTGPDWAQLRDDPMPVPPPQQPS